VSAILDTSFLLALTDSNDKNHKRVLSVARQLRDPLILPVPVLPEICYLLASRLGHAVMRHFLQDLVSSNIVLESLTIADLQRANQILQQYADSRLDFVDATVVTIAERRNITRILTLDRRDYTMIRPKHCPYFDLLP
jgi:predicted nucleic acid-binding protein